MKLGGEEMNIIQIYRNMIDDKRFIKKTVAIAIPITVQLLLNTILNFIDILMIGSLGETTIAAVGLANKVFFVFSLLLFGICSGSSILTSQYFGKKDIKSIRRVLGISLIIGLIGSIFFVIPGVLCPEFVMSIFTPSTNAITIGASYLIIVAISYPLTAITNVYTSILRSVNEVRLPVAISLLSIFINITLNYTLIFGHFGAPKLGVQGAALGTLIARIIECVSILLIIYIKKGPAAAKVKELVGFNKEFIKKFFTTVTPVIINEFMWGLGVTMYSLVYGRMDDGAVASITITQNVEQIITVMFQGIGSATAVILGNELGANKLEKAEVHAKYLIIMQLGLSLFMGVVCFLIKTPLIGLFSVSETITSDISKCLIVFIMYLPFKMFNLVNIVGVLRSGGDTKAALLLDITGVWVIGIPFAFLGSIFLGLPIHIVYAMVMFEEIYKFILGTKRYSQKKWLKNIV